MRNSAAADPEREGGAGGVPADVEALECVLAPGDALYIPPYWWHQVLSEGRSLAVNFWWSVHSAMLQQMMKALDHSMLLERPDDLAEPHFRRQAVW